ncbi:MAG: hypothetical protein QXN71_00355, partial [Candidatus Aenigmatarchaeota archaeon]
RDLEGRLYEIGLSRQSGFGYQGNAKWSLRGFEHEHMTFGLRNSIERLRLVKNRTKGFYNNINCKDLKSGIETSRRFSRFLWGCISLKKGF